MNRLIKKRDYGGPVSSLHGRLATRKGVGSTSALMTQLALFFFSHVRITSCWFLPIKSNGVRVFLNTCTHVYHANTECKAGSLLDASTSNRHKRMSCPVGVRARSFRLNDEQRRVRSRRLNSWGKGDTCHDHSSVIPSLTSMVTFKTAMDNEQPAECQRICYLIRWVPVLLLMVDHLQMCRWWCSEKVPGRLSV